MNQEQKHQHPVQNVLRGCFHQLPLARGHNHKSFDQEINHLPLTENQIMAVYPYLQTPVTTNLSIGHSTARTQTEAAPVSFIRMTQRSQHELRAKASVPSTKCFKGLFSPLAPCARA